jgi:hypothetical protein
MAQPLQVSTTTCLVGVHAYVDQTAAACLKAACFAQAGVAAALTAAVQLTATVVGNCCSCPEAPNVQRASARQMMPADGSHASTNHTSLPESALHVLALPQPLSHVMCDAPTVHHAAATALHCLLAKLELRYTTHHSCNLTVLSSKYMVFDKKSMPMVACREGNTCTSEESQQS